MNLEGTFTLILAIFSVASVLGAASAIFYAVKQRTTIQILTSSNNAYIENNKILNGKIESLDKQVTTLKGSVQTLENIKTPDVAGLVKLITDNHLTVMDKFANLNGEIESIKKKGDKQ